MKKSNEAHEPSVGYVLLRDVENKKRRTTFETKVHAEADYAEIVGFSKPEGEMLFPWDDRIQVGAVVLKPVAKKQDFPDGKGGLLAVCYYADIKVFKKVV